MEKGFLLCTSFPSQDHYFTYQLLGCIQSLRETTDFQELWIRSFKPAQPFSRQHQIWVKSVVCLPALWSHEMPQRERFSLFLARKLCYVYFWIRWAGKFMALKLIQSTIVLLPPSVVVLFCLFGVACLGFFNALVLDKTKMHVTTKAAWKLFGLWAQERFSACQRIVSSFCPLHTLLSLL